MDASILLPPLDWYNLSSHIFALHLTAKKKGGKKKRGISGGTALNGNKEMCLNPLGCLGCLK